MLVFIFSSQGQFTPETQVECNSAGCKKKHLHWSCNQPQAHISASLICFLKRKNLSRKQEKVCLHFSFSIITFWSLFHPSLYSGLSSFPLSLSSLRKSQEPPSICQLLSGELTRPESWMLPLNHQGYVHLVLKACSLPQHMPLSSLIPSFFSPLLPCVASYHVICFPTLLHVLLASSLLVWLHYCSTLSLPLIPVTLYFRHNNKNDTNVTTGIRLIETRTGQIYLDKHTIAYSYKIEPLLIIMHGY